MEIFKNGLTTVDEEDDDLMDQIGEAVSIASTAAFEIFENIDFKPSHKLTKFELNRFLDLIDATIGDIYTKKQGLKWKDDKFEELQEPGLVYASITINSVLIAFVLYRLCNDAGTNVLYLYEIHVDAKHQKLKYGSRLLSGFHNLADHLNQWIKVPCTQLTVFPDNSRALKWYNSLGYTFNEHSPMPTLLRNGNLKNPEYFILERPVTKSTA